MGPQRGRTIKNRQLVVEGKITEKSSGANKRGGNKLRICRDRKNSRGFVGEWVAGRQ